MSESPAPAASSAADATGSTSRSGPGPGELFRTFLGIALRSFGGGLSLWIQREVVERKRWLDEEEFLSGLALARLLPGANQVNLTAHIGARFAGWRGAAAAVTGVVAVPFVILFGLGLAYFEFHEVPALRAALGGAVAVAAGMAVAMGVKLARPYATRPDAIVLAVAAFVAVHVFHGRIPVVVGVLAPVAMAWFWPRAPKASPPPRTAPAARDSAA